MNTDTELKGMEIEMKAQDEQQDQKTTNPNLKNPTMYEPKSLQIESI